MNQIIDTLRKIKRKLSNARRGRPVSLHVVPELGALHFVELTTLSSKVNGPAPGVIGEFVASAHIEEDGLKIKLAGRTAGVSPPPWHDGSGGAPAHGVHVGIVRDAFHAPEFGAVILKDGRVLHSTVAEALYFTPSLAALPFAAPSEAGATLTPPIKPNFIRRCSVFVPWGGRFNYGHFLIDGLTALAALSEAGLLHRYPPVAPRLTPWQRDLLRLMLGDTVKIRELDDPLIRIGEVAFATPMNHFLHAPNAPLATVRKQILSRVSASSGGAKRIYLSRKGDEKRRMINEAAFEDALTARGFVILDASSASVEEQVAVFRDAEVVVGATGAAFANCLFCSPGTRVFEIQPINYTGIWTRGLCHYLDLDWHGYFAASPIEETDVYVEGLKRDGVLFEWEAPLESFLAFLDQHL
jgi:capsular polysaccharide biosynthesis protein